MTTQAFFLNYFSYLGATLDTPLNTVEIRCIPPKGLPSDVALNLELAYRDQRTKKTHFKVISGKLLLNKTKPEFLETFPNGATKLYRDGLKQLTIWNNQGYGIYLVVNPGGGKDTDISACHYLFYECDNITKDYQWAKLEELEEKLGQKASCVVETYKSLHIYFKLATSIYPEEWKILQQRLIQTQDSDPAIHNPARLMRLPGYQHKRWDDETKEIKSFSIKITQQTDSQFTLKTLDSVLDAWDESRWNSTPENQVISDPLDDPWDIRNLAVYLEGYKENGREGWITCKCPAHQGESNDSLHINMLTGAPRCHAGCNPRDIKSAAIREARKSGKWVDPKVNQKSNDQNTANTNHKTTKELEELAEKELQELEEKIKKLVLEDLDGGRLSFRKLRLAKEYGINPLEIQKIYELYSEVAETLQEKPYLIQELESIINNSKKEIKLRDFLPEVLAKPIEEITKWQQKREFVALTVLLTTASSLFKVGTKINLGVGFQQPPSLYSAIIAESGQTKSPVINNLCKYALTILQKEAHQEFLNDKKRHEEDMEYWEALKGKKNEQERNEQFPNGKPTEPTQKIFYYEDATGESIIRQFEAQPEQGLLSLQDELAGLSKAYNQYRGGKGKDEEDILRFYDGSGSITLRANGVRANVYETLFSILGGIQPEVLQSSMGNFDDNNGGFARYIYVNQPTGRTGIFRKQSVNITQLLLWIYRAIDALPKQEYSFDEATWLNFQKVYDALDELQIEDPMQSMRYVWGKSKGRVGRFAVILHALRAVAAGNIPTPIVPQERLDEAIQLTWAYANEIKAFYTGSSGANGGRTSLPAVWGKIIRLSELKHESKGDPWIRPRDLVTGIGGKMKPDTKKARSLMRELVEMGYGSLKGSGLDIYYSYLKDSPDSPNNNSSSNPNTPDNPSSPSFPNSPDSPGFDEPAAENIETNDIGDIGDIESYSDDQDIIPAPTINTTNTMTETVSTNTHNAQDTFQSTYNPLNALKCESGKIEVDLEKIDLDYTPSETTPIPDWKPDSKLPDYASINKCYLDIETTGLDPNSDRVIMVGLMDEKGNKQCISNPDEKELLKAVLEALEEMNPQQVYGHNLFNFDLPFLMARCAHHKLTHPWKEGWKSRRITDSSVNGQPIEFLPIDWVARGRRKLDIADTYQQCAIADKSQAIFNGYGLKDSVITLGLRKERRLELSNNEIQAAWNAQTPEGLQKIQEYLEYDLEDTKLLADRLFPGIYYQGEVVPCMSFQELGYMSSASKWERIFESLYETGRNSPRIPVSDEKVKYPGGSVSCKPGLYKDTVKLDVNSLYPSLMIKYQLTGEKDSKLLGAAVMKYLLERRLELKSIAKQPDHPDYELAKHQQHALKILINSGYGFLGVGGYPYNSMKHAALICAYGAKVLQLMEQEITKLGGQIIECDTDGIIFNNLDANRALDVVNQALPSGITAGIDFSHTDIYVSGMKNYILFGADGETKAVGEFRKRQNYKLKREFVETYLKLCLESSEQSNQQAEDYWQRLRAKLQSGEYDVGLLTERKRISKADVKLQAAGLGKPGDVVFVYYAEQERFHAKSGKQIKSAEVPVTNGQYYAQKYVEDIDKLHTSMLQVIYH